MYYGRAGSVYRARFNILSAFNRTGIRVATTGGPINAGAAAGLLYLSRIYPAPLSPPPPVFALLARRYVTHAFSSPPPPSQKR